MIYEYDDEVQFEKIKTKKLKNTINHKERKKKERIEIKQLKDSFWRYLIDHSRIVGTAYCIYFYIQDKDDFFRRVKAREDGTFKRKDIGEEKERLRKEMKKMEWMKSNTEKFLSEISKYKERYEALQRGNDKKTQLIAHLITKPSLYDRLLYFLKQKIDRRINMRVHSKRTRGSRK